MKFKTMKEIEERKAAILKEMEQEGADLDALKKEMEELRENADAIKEAVKKAEEIRQSIASGAAGIVINETHVAEPEKKSDKEVRASAEYAEAYKKYILTGDDKECRSLLTTMVSGEVPVPELVEGIIKHAWESNTFLTHVTKTAFRGILKVPFEKSADPAYVHTEGTTGLTEEDLQLGIVSLTPGNIKKWIKISDEAIAMGGEAFVRYIYEELAQRVMEKLVDLIVAKVNAAPTSHSDVAIAIPKLTEAPSTTVVQDAADQTSEEATDICVVLNPLSIKEFRAAHAAGYFGIDPFAGVTLVKCSKLPAYSSADSNAMYGIVGDLKAIQVNYPEGEGIVTKWDDLTYAEDDMVKVIARQYAGIGVTAPGRLVKLCKPAPAETT